MVPEAVSFPVVERDDVEVEGELFFCAEELCEFCGGHAVSDGYGVACGEGEAFGVGEWSFDMDSVDGVGSVEDDVAEVVLCGGFEGVEERGDVGVEAASDVLDVEDEGVDAGELVGLGALALSVEAVDGESGSGVVGVGDAGVGGALESVFGCEEGVEVESGGVVEEVDGGYSVLVAAGVVGDEGDVASEEGLEVLLLEDVDAGEGHGGCLRVR
ncbi:MAG: hypothetical protein RMJ43_07180 [Chloroherpetonaceae bacterium]|nr:hypothetical protein [Chloroherpetonaceae bacterium]